MGSEKLLKNNKNFNFVFLIFIIALALRLVYAFLLKTDQLYFPDSMQWDQIALNFLSGKGLIVGPDALAVRMPLYSIFLSGIYFIFGKSNLLAVRIIQAFISAFTCVLIYFIATSVFRDNRHKEKISRIAALISAFYPFFIYYSGAILTETLFIFLTCLIILFLSKKKFFLTGIFLGLAILCRAETLLFSFLMVVGLFFFVPPKNALKNSLIILVIMFVILSPWITRNYMLFGKFVPLSTTGGWTFWEGNNPWNKTGGPCQPLPGVPEISNMNEVERDAFLKAKTVEEIKKDPKRIFRLSVKKFFRFWNIKLNTTDPNYSSPRNNILSILSFGPVLMLSIIGFISSFWNKKNLIFIYLLIFYIMSINLIFVSSIRYRLPIEPYLIIFASYAIYILLPKRNMQGKGEK